MVKKKSERKPKNIMEAVGFQNIFNSEKTDFLLGLIILIIATYIIIAMVSFLNTGQADQSILEDLRPGEWLNTNRTFKNYCGSIGSIIAYTLITVNFGLPAFIIPVFLIIVGLKMMKICTINLWKWFMCLAIVMIWTSVSFAKFLAPFMENYIFNPGGNHGLFCVQTMENVIGAPGLTAVLIFVAIAFLTYLSSETINIVRKILNPVGYLTRKIKFTVINNANHDSSESSETIYEDKTNTTIQEVSPTKDDTPEETEIHTPTVIDLTEDISDNNNKAKEPEKEKTDNPDSELIVEISKTTERPDDSRKIEDDDIIKTPINPKEPFTGYKYPTIDLLKKYDNDGKPFVDMDEIRANNEQIVKVLKSFGVDISEIKATVGPTITLYEITPAPGVRISKIRNLEDDIALSLSALGIRIIAPIPGKGTIGIEVPNRKANIVSMESIINSKKFIDAKMELPIALGKTISNDVLIVSNDGVYGITLSANVASSERFARSRAEQIKNLLQQYDLSKAKCVVWDNKLFIAVDNMVFVADARFRASFDGDMADTFNYEWWLWDNVPVYYWTIINDKLCFFTSDNRLCEFYDGFSDYISDDLLVAVIDGDGVTISSQYADYNKIALNMAYKSCIESADIINVVAGALVINTERLYTSISEGDTVYFDVTAGTINGFPVSVSIPYIVNSIDITSGQVTFVTTDGTAVAFTAGMSTLLSANQLRISKAATEEYDMEINEDVASNNTQITDADGNSVQLIQYNGVSSYTAIIYKKRPVVAYWQTGSYDFGSSMYAKTIERFSVSFDRESPKKMKLYYTTAYNGKENLFKDLKKNVDFDFDAFSFLLYTFDRQFETSYTRRLLIRNFNFIAFRLVSDEAEDFSVDSISFVYKVNKLNRGEH